MSLISRFTIDRLGVERLAPREGEQRWVRRGGALRP